MVVPVFPPTAYPETWARWPGTPFTTAIAQQRQSPALIEHCQILVAVVVEVGRQTRIPNFRQLGQLTGLEAESAVEQEMAAPLVPGDEIEATVVVDVRGDEASRSDGERAEAARIGCVLERPDNGIEQ